MLTWETGDLRKGNKGMNTGKVEQGHIEKTECQHQGQVFKNLLAIIFRTFKIRKQKPRELEEQPKFTQLVSGRIGVQTQNF